MKHLLMSCDHGCDCRNSVKYAPRILVPSATLLVPGHLPLRMMTTLHYCEMHISAPAVTDFLTPALKVKFERAARQQRPIGFKCDFERARIEPVLVTTPEYRAFLEHLLAGPRREAVLHV
jgi:hypothetical protein